MAHNEGLRRLGLTLKGNLDKASPLAFAELLMENMEVTP